MIAPAWWVADWRTFSGLVIYILAACRVPLLPPVQRVTWSWFLFPAHRVALFLVPAASPVGHATMVPDVCPEGQPTLVPATWPGSCPTLVIVAISEHHEIHVTVPCSVVNSTKFKWNNLRIAVSHIPYCLVTVHRAASCQWPVLNPNCLECILSWLCQTLWDAWAKCCSWLGTLQQKLVDWFEDLIKWHSLSIAVSFILNFSVTIHRDCHTMAEVAPKLFGMHQPSIRCPTRRWWACFWSVTFTVNVMWIVECVFLHS